MNLSPSRTAIVQALDTVKDPKSGQGLSLAGLVRGLTIREGRVGFVLEIKPEDAALYAPVRDAAETVLRGVPGVEHAQVVLTAESDAPPPPPRRAAVADDPRAALRP